MEPYGQLEHYLCSSLCSSFVLKFAFKFYVQVCIQFPIGQFSFMFHIVQLTSLQLTVDYSLWSCLRQMFLAVNILSIKWFCLWLLVCYSDWSPLCTSVLLEVLMLCLNILIFNGYEPKLGRSDIPESSITILFYCLDPSKSVLER